MEEALYKKSKNADAACISSYNPKSNEVSSRFVNKRKLTQIIFIFLLIIALLNQLILSSPKRFRWYFFGMLQKYK